jgi:anti-repressor protein
MNELQIFNYSENQVRTVMKDGQPYFVAKDICEILDITWNGLKTLNQIPDAWIGVVSLTTPGGKQDATIITESAVYKLAFRSNKEQADNFTNFVAEQVLPSIRKHGMYAKDELLDNPELLLDIITKYKAERDRNKLLVDKLEQQKPLVMFAETCIASNDSILVRELAKLASKNGVIIGEKRLYKKLREWGLILGRKNEPSQKAMEANWFEVKKGTYSTPYGSESFSTTKVSPKGQVYIIERLKKEQSESMTA